MITKSIKNIDLFRLLDALDNREYYGSNQEWYGRHWQRMSGCGPSTVTNIIYYISTRKEPARSGGLTKEECLALMREMWNYVTPSLGGVSSTAMLKNGMERYLKEKNMSLKMETLDIPKIKSGRPEIGSVADFVAEALAKDCPVAFLNLERGNVVNLESWHWVTIVSIQYDKAEERVIVEVLDSGNRKKIDLGLWLRTTRLGGGFVSFEI